MGAVKKINLDLITGTSRKNALRPNHLEAWQRDSWQLTLTVTIGD